MAAVPRHPQLRDVLIQVRLNKCLCKSHQFAVLSDWVSMPWVHLSQGYVDKEFRTPEAMGLREGWGVGEMVAKDLGDMRPSLPF